MKEDDDACFQMEQIQIPAAKELEKNEKTDGHQRVQQMPKSTELEPALQTEIVRLNETACESEDTQIEELRKRIALLEKDMKCKADEVISLKEQLGIATGKIEEMRKENEELKEELEQQRVSKLERETSVLFEEEANDTSQLNRETPATSSVEFIQGRLSHLNMKELPNQSTSQAAERGDETPMRPAKTNTQLGDYRNHCKDVEYNTEKCPEPSDNSKPQAIVINPKSTRNRNIPEWPSKQVKDDGPDIEFIDPTPTKENWRVYAVVDYGDFCNAGTLSDRFAAVRYFGITSTTTRDRFNKHVSSRKLTRGVHIPIEIDCFTEEDMERYPEFLFLEVAATAAEYLLCSLKNKLTPKCKSSAGSVAKPTNELAKKVAMEETMRSRVKEKIRYALQWGSFEASLQGNTPNSTPTKK